MNSGHLRNMKGSCDDSGVATLIDYIMISGILMGLFIVLLVLVNAHFMQGPADAITYSAFTDIGNGISTRIVDTYAIAPENGNITSAFDIPDDVAGRQYFVTIDTGGDLSAQLVTVSRDSVTTSIALAGIGSSRKVGGNTTGMGINRIRYDSGGFF